MKPRIVFMGTPEFAVRSLQACLELGEVVAVVTQPDRPAGRGQKPRPPPVKELAEQRGIRVLQPERLKGTSFAQELLALRPQVVVVTAYGKILPPEVLVVPPSGSVNVHASLLPRHRGAAPIQWAIASGDEQTGVCLMKMDAGMDTGPIISCLETPIGAEEGFPSLHDRLAQLGYELLRRDLPRYLSGELRPRPQPAEGVTMAPMLKKEHGQLDFTRPAVELERRIRAFTPWPGAFTYLQRERVKVQAAAPGKGEGTPGELLSLGPGGIELACGAGSLFLTTLQPEGKRAMSAQEFLAGHPLVPGETVFSTPPLKEPPR